MLVLDPQLKDAWRTSTSIAYQRLNMMMNDEFAYHRGNTLLVRKLTKRFEESQQLAFDKDDESNKVRNQLSLRLTGAVNNGQTMFMRPSMRSMMIAPGKELNEQEKRQPTSDLDDDSEQESSNNPFREFHEPKDKKKD